MTVTKIVQMAQMRMCQGTICRQNIWQDRQSFLAGFETLFPFCCQHICPIVWRNCQNIWKNINKLPDYHSHII